jgi:hypothetical protein
LQGLGLNSSEGSDGDNKAEFVSKKQFDDKPDLHNAGTWLEHFTEKLH